MANLNGKVAVVTGAAKGIGKACAFRMLADGVDGLALLDFDIETLNATAAELNAEDKILAIKCDVGILAEVETAFEQVFERFGKVDILVNNAGITRDAMFHKMSEEQWDKVISVDLSSLFYCCKQVVPGMRERKYGKIVNISSTSAYGNVGQTNYAAAKAGVQGFTRTLGRELGRSNCTVNVICPGFIETDIMKTVPEHLLKASIERHPMQRFGQPEEIASVVSFLSGDDSSYVNGESILVCGGALTV